MIFFTADSHYGHAMVLTHDNRPFSTIEEHDAILIENWNKIVKPNDIVWHLGDFAFRNKQPIEWYTKQLHGRISLIRGNHDDRGAWKCRSLFSSTHEAYYLKCNNEKIFLFHYACRTWRNSHHGSIHLFGHSHGKLPSYGKSMDVGIMNTGYKPISFDEVAQIMKDKPVTNHHPDSDSVE